MTIPQGYKQTELGIIPEDWEYSPSQKYLKEISMGPFGSDIKVENFVGFGIPVLNGANLQSYRLIDRFENYVTSQKAAALKKAVANKGDIIITHRGTLGQVTYIPKSAKFDRYVISQSQFRVRFNECIDSEFIVRYLLSPIGQECLLEFKGHTGVPALAQPTTNFRNLPLLIPPIAEQRAIAEALSDVDGLIAALDKKIAKKRLLKQGAMCKLLSLSGRGKKWFNTKLGNVVNIRKGSMLTSDKFVAGNIPVIAGGKIPAGYHNVANRPANTITISASGASAGYVALYNKPIFATDCSTIEPCSTYDIHYIYHLLKYYQSEIFAMQTGGAQPHVHPSDLNELQILYAKDIEEQQAIATILSDMDKEIADLEAQRDKYRLLKSGMMQKLLTGQIRLVKQQAKIVPLGVDVPAVREIPVATHIIAGHIVNRSHKSRGWGRTKLQKSLHLIGYCTQLNLGTEYIRNTAGPDDQQLMNHIDQKFRQYRHVNKVCEKLPDGRTHYSYTPTPMIQDVETAYEKYPKELREQVDALIDKLNTMDLAGAEILSTLYAVWNNRIIKQEQITDDLLTADFYAWSKHKADFEEARVRKALNYMRDNNIIPVGWGKYIDKR